MARDAAIFAERVHLLCVFAFTLTTSSGHPRSFARFVLIAGLCGLIFGSCR